MKKGFTLVETLIVVAIVAAISAYAITFSNVGRRQTILNLEAQKIAELILRAKSLAIATFNRQASVCGYGVEIDYQNPQTYSLFSYAEYDPSTGEPDCSDIKSSGRNYIPGASSTVAVGVRLNKASSDSLNAVLFVPPEPKTLISTNPGGSVKTKPAKIYLETIDDPPARAYKEIFVSTVGQVDF